MLRAMAENTLTRIPPLGDESSISRRWRPVPTGAVGCHELIFECEGDVYRLAIWPAASNVVSTLMGSLEREAIGDTIWLDALETTDVDIGKRECLDKVRGLLVGIAQELERIEKEIR